MSELINQPGDTKIVTKLPSGWVLDKGEQPRLPRVGDWFLSAHTDEPQQAVVRFRKDRKFIVVRSTPDDSWWPEWLLADYVAMNAKAQWKMFGADPAEWCGDWKLGSGSECSFGLLINDMLDLKLPDWPRERYAESKIANPHKAKQ